MRLRAGLPGWPVVCTLAIVARVSKYDALRDYLAGSGRREVELTYADIDRLVGGLPPGARDGLAWWSDDGVAVRHVQVRHGWGAAGYQIINIDLEAELVTFARQPGGSGRVPGG